MVQIVQYSVLSDEQTLGEVGPGGLNPTNVTTSGTAANTTLGAATVGFTIVAGSKRVRYDYGVGVSAHASNSLVLEPYTERSHAVPRHKTGDWRVSVIDSAS